MRGVQCAVPVPPLPLDSMCQDQPTLLLPPTIRADNPAYNPAHSLGALQPTRW
jgi:hypothetical protein